LGLNARAHQLRAAAQVPQEHVDRMIAAVVALLHHEQEPVALGQAHHRGQIGSDLAREHLVDDA
jgi:hypothetical protein